MTKLTRRESLYGGLDLTPCTLAAIIKYPWLGGSGKALTKKKFGAYVTEQSEFDVAMACVQSGASRSLEAEIMDWADDIAYSVHDVYDFYRAGMIPLARLKSDPEEWEPVKSRIKADANELTQAVEDLRLNFLQLVPDIEFNGSASHRAQMRKVSSDLISHFLVERTEQVDPDSNGSEHLKIPREAIVQVKLLKELVWEYVIDDRSLAAQQVGQRTCMSMILNTIWDDMHNGKVLMPLSFRELLDDKEPPGRVLADFVSGLTERQAVALYRQLMGLQEGSIMDVITI